MHVLPHEEIERVNHARVAAETGLQTFLNATHLNSRNEVYSRHNSTDVEPRVHGGRILPSRTEMASAKRPNRERR
jgi:hypothetical protein